MQSSGLTIPARYRKQRRAAVGLRAGAVGSRLLLVAAACGPGPSVVGDVIRMVWLTQRALVFGRAGALLRIYF
jgi:hypothetical protein